MTTRGGKKKKRFLVKVVSTANRHFTSEVSAPTALAAEKEAAREVRAENDVNVLCTEVVEEGPLGVEDQAGAA